MTYQEAYDIAKDFIKGHFKIQRYKEYDNIYLFGPAGDVIAQPIYVNKNNGEVGVFNPMEDEIPN